VPEFRVEIKYTAAGGEGLCIKWYDFDVSKSIVKTGNGV
jgi:hypothetical protein